MTTESEVPTGAGTEIVAPEPQQENPEVAAPESAEEQQPQEDADPLKAAEKRLEKERQNFQRRIDRKHAQAVEAAERARVLEARLQQYEQQRQPETPPQADVEAIAAKKAEEIASHRELSRRVQDVLSKGSALPEFQAHCNTAIEELGLLDAKGQPTPLLSVFLEADAPHEVFDHIGKNPEVAAQFDGLTPTQAARRLAKLEAEIAQAKAPKTSAAPKPLKPVTGNSSSDPDPSQMTDKQFAEWRRKQIEARYAR